MSDKVNNATNKVRDLTAGPFHNKAQNPFFFIIIIIPSTLFLLAACPG